jgi:hypothetical protein
LKKRNSQDGFCDHCKKKTRYRVKARTAAIICNEFRAEYTCRVAVCDKCGNIVHVAELDKENLKNANSAYSKEVKKAKKAG